MTDDPRVILAEMTERERKVALGHVRDPEDVPRLLAAVRVALKLADDARPSLSAPPADCSNACERGECDCSGVMRALAWSLDPGELRAGILAALTGKDEAGD